MPRRNVVYATNEIYHVYNRSIAGERIFTSQVHLRKALELINYYRYSQRLSFSKYKRLPEELKKHYNEQLEKQPPLVEFYAFAIMPNHYHFLIKQLQDKGIVKFVSNFQNSWAKYYNLKNERNGALFTNQFKGKWIESDKIFLHVSRYIHLNHVTAYIIPIEKLSDYPWNSFQAYMHDEQESFVNTDFLLKMFPSREKYKQFVIDQADYQKSLVSLKDIILEDR